MANYENGEATRQAIINTCKQLFYEKGFNATSYSDICELAHVNRGTIYYHFDNKEMIRFEVQLAYLKSNKHNAGKYCADSRYWGILSMYMFWNQIMYDEKMRRFSLEICNDYPAYTGEKDCTFSYTVAYNELWEPFWERSNIPQLAYSSVYGYTMSCLRMLCEHPQEYNSKELFEQCVKACCKIWGIPDDLMDAIWENVEKYIVLIPEDEYKSAFKGIS